MAGGQQFAAQQGSVGHGGFVVPLVGQQISVQQQDLEDQHGQWIFSFQGNLTGGITIPIDGQVITSAHGTLTYVPTTTGDLTIPLQAGQEITFFQQNVIVTPTQLLSGQAITSAHGTLVPSSDRAVTGSSFTSATGFLAANVGSEDTFIASAVGDAVPSHTVPLVGSEVAASTGTLVPSTSNRDADLEPDAATLITSAAGTASPVTSKALTGSEITSSQGNIGAPGRAELFGEAITVEQGFFGREHAVTGLEITSATGTLVGEKGVVALVGSEISVSQGVLVSENIWSDVPAPTGSWSSTSSPSSSWTEVDDPDSTWRRI